MELIVAIGIATTALIGGMMFLHASVAFVKTQGQERAASEITFSQVEILRSRGAGPLENCAARKIETDLPSRGGLPGMACLLDVSDCPGAPGVKTVTVTVTWKGWRRTRRVSRTAFVRTRSAE